MNRQEQLIATLSEVFEVEQSDAISFTIRMPGYQNLPSQLTASESDLVAYAEKNALDGLNALGAIGEDSTGRVAAIGLLAVHIEEAIASAAPHAMILRVLPEGLDERRV